MSNDISESCKNCSKLWERIDNLESEIKKRDKQATWTYISSGVLPGLLISNLMFAVIKQI